MWKWIVVLVFVIFTASIFPVTSFIYYPGQEDFDSCASNDVERIRYKGTRMYYKRNGERLAVYFHGSGGTACNHGFYKKIFDEANYSLLLVEYPGYANDPVHSPSRSGVLSAMKNAMEFVKSQGLSVEVVAGTSIGSAPASRYLLLSEEKPKRVILIAPFARLSDTWRFPLRFFGSWYLTLRGEEYNNISALEGYKGALLVVHGAEDGLVPFWSGRELYDSSKASPKIFLSVTGVGHGVAQDVNILEVRGVRKKIINFLTEDLSGMANEILTE